MMSRSVSGQGARGRDQRDLDASLRVRLFVQQPPSLPLKMAKAPKKIQKEPSARITDFFQRNPRSSPMKGSPTTTTRAGTASTPASASRPASSSQKVGGPSAAKTIGTIEETLAGSSDSELSSIPTSPSMQPSRAVSLSPTKPASKRKAKFESDVDSDAEQKTATVYVQQSRAATPDARNSNAPSKRLRFSSPDDDIVPDSQSASPMQLTMPTPPPRPGTPPRLQQHTPPPPNETPRSKRTREIVADIRQNAVRKAKEMSSPTEAPPLVFDDELKSDSSVEDDGDVLGPLAATTGKGKACACLPHFI